MISLTLTPSQARRIRSGALDVELSQDQALSVRGAITAAAGAGAPAKLAPCRHCGEMLGTVARRAHEPHCKERAR